MTRLSLVGLLVATIGSAVFAQPTAAPSVVGVWKVNGPLLNKLTMKYTLVE